MPSFDVVSEIDTHELTNAVDQAVRELTQRFDFKGTDAAFELEETTVTMTAPSDFQLKQMLDILKLRIAKRGIDVACLEVKDPEVNLARAKQLAILKHGIDAEAGRKVSRLLKDSKIKVQAQIQGDKVRVIGKKRDDLQEAIAFLRKAALGVPLQFNNFRASCRTVKAYLSRVRRDLAADGPAPGVRRARYLKRRSTRDSPIARTRSDSRCESRRGA